LDKKKAGISMSITIPEHQIIWYSGPIKQRDSAEPVAYALIKSDDLFYPAKLICPIHDHLSGIKIEGEEKVYVPLQATAHACVAEYEGIEITSGGCLSSKYIQPSFHALETIVREALTQTGKDIDDEMIRIQYILDQIYDAFLTFSFDTARATLKERDLLDCHLYVDARYRDTLNASSWWFTPDGQEIDIIYIRTGETLVSTFMGGKTAYMTYRTPYSLTTFAEAPEIAYGSRLFLVNASSLGGPTAYYGYIPEQETMIRVKPHAFNAVEGPRKWSVEYWQKKYAQLLRGEKSQDRPAEDLDYSILSHHIYWQPLWSYAK
jgi:hypothetical protein